MSRGKRKIIRVLFFERIHFRLLIILLSFASALLGLSVPYFQKIFSQDMSTQTLLICVIAALAYLATNQLALFVGQTESVHAQRKLSQIIYRHNLNLRPLTLQDRSIGEVVSLYATDVPSVTVWLEQSLPYGLTTIFPLVLTPFYLYYFYELPLYVSFLMVAVIVLLNSGLAYRQSLFFFKFKLLAAERMGLVNEWIQNIRGLKILNWIEGFENRIIRKRREETKNRISMLINGQIMNSVSSNMQFWLNLGMLGFLIWWTLHKEIVKGDLIALLWVTTVFLSRPLRQLPWFFTFVFDAWTSFNRLAEFLSLENIPESVRHREPSDKDSLLEIEKLNLEINGRKILKDITLRIKPNEMVALIGPVGSGKSMLIKSIIGEIPFHAERFYTKPISYLPQEHFIMSASLRDNMNFHYNSSEANDAEVLTKLSTAQFNFEIDRVTDGLETIIGERGVNLSGGQKQRVSLARQLMQTRNLLVLDDPLSAVDISTEKSLITEFAKLKSATGSILLTTQRFTALPHCDRIIFLRDGSIEFDGPAEVFLAKSEYRNFLGGLI